MNRSEDHYFRRGIMCGGVAAGASPALAQTFQSYRCADHTQFIVGFYDHDSRAHLQVDGRDGDAGAGALRCRGRAIRAAASR